MPTTTSMTLDTDRLRLEMDGRIATFWIDVPDASVNTISEATLDAFEEAVDLLRNRATIRGAVFISAKKNTFIAGADLDMLKAFDMPADVRALSRRAHRLLERLQKLPIPTVAAINGPAMGGGLEMTLGCSYRIATTHDKTVMALPEVKLGLLPGGGGTQYLPRLVGVQQALTMMLTGKNIYPKKAKRIGLVDALIHPHGLHQAAVDAARRLADGTLTPNRDKQSFTERLLESNPVSRRIIYQQAGERAQKQTRGNYPAPPKIIDCVKAGMEKGLDAGLDTEARHFADLVFTPESRALVSLFFAKQKGDRNPHADDARPVHEMGMLGAGLMGGGIAQVSANGGLEVVLKDIDLERAAEGKKIVWDALNKKARKRIISSFERDQITERVMPTVSYADVADCELIIEAVPEDLDLKRTVLADTEAVIAEDAIFASNTSSLPIAEIAAEAEHPERVLGMHYFSPVPQMPLLEIIVTEDTSHEALATAYEVGLTQGKTVIVVNDGPGFYTTRILAIYMNEALLLLEEGADAEAIDAQMKDFGFPMGPYELFDLVGIDVAAKITTVMGDALSDRAIRISDTAATLAEAGLLGQKSNKGFYHYDADDESHDKTTQDFNEAIYRHVGGMERTGASNDVQHRMGLMMVNEAVRCLEEGILTDPVDGDLGAVFGLGFPPFRGGPFRYIDQEGASTIVNRLRRLAQTHGPRFQPADLLVQKAEAGDAFHEE